MLKGGKIMFDKLENVEKRYEELNAKISDPEVIANQSEWKKCMKEHADIQEVVEKYREYKDLTKTIEDLKEMLNDKEMHDLAQMELDESREKLPKIEEELKSKKAKLKCMLNSEQEEVPLDNICELADKVFEVYLYDEEDED